MRKHIAAVMVFILLIFSTGSSYIYAAKTVSRGYATGQLKDVKYISSEKGEMVNVTAASYTDYSVMELTSPRRIVLDIYNLIAPGKQQAIESAGKIIRRIRYAQFDTYTARIVLEVNSQEDYGVEKTDSGLLLYIGEKPDPEAGDNSNSEKGQDTADGTEKNQAEPGQNLSEQAGEIKNIEYRKSGDRVYFILSNAVLTEGDEFLSELYTDSYDDTGKKYTLTFLSGESELGSGIMKINDNYLKSLEVKTNLEEGTTSLIFDAPGKNTYFAYTRGSSGITSITVMKPAEDKKKLVVIDAGHGDSATGAVYKNLYEKDFNLDIAKRLNALLEKKGVNTYMLRDNDSYIANYERAYIANNMNAKLYLSIHNNAMDNKNYRGTMTLYCPSASSSFNGKDFASIVQKQVLSTLKTIDRKTISRPDLIVLKATAMPAALVELTYMTNSTDRANLQKESFRQKAAQALCDSVIKALPKVK